jgi:hypothetical protein
MKIWIRLSKCTSTKEQTKKKHARVLQKTFPLIFMEDLDLLNLLKFP